MIRRLISPRRPRPACSRSAQYAARSSGAALGAIHRSCARRNCEVLPHSRKQSSVLIAASGIRVAISLMGLPRWNPWDVGRRGCRETNAPQNVVDDQLVFGPAKVLGDRCWSLDASVRRMWSRTRAAALASLLSALFVSCFGERLPFGHASSFAVSTSVTCCESSSWSVC